MFLRHRKNFSAAEDAIQKDDFEKADSILSEIIQDDEACIEALFNRALVRQRRRDYEAALVDINQLIELRPENSIALMLKGEILLDQGHFEQAYAELHKACVLEKDNGRAFCSLAKAAAKLGKRHEAIDYLEQALHFEQQYTLASVLTDLMMEKK